MQQWWEQFQGDVRDDFQDEEAFYATQRAVRRADQRRHRAFAEEEINNPNSTLDDEDPMWDDLWTATTSDDE
jgi:hypothetical protein